MVQAYSLWFILSLAITGSCGKIKNVVLFGDSYTDQSRQHSIQKGIYPGKDYQEIYPPADTAADGGYQWPWYLGQYGNFTIWNYAVGGAVCSNDLTPVNGFPDVIQGQAAWFVQDHITGAVLDLDPSEFIVDIFIGTNDVGLNSFITDSQASDVSLPNLAECQFQAIRNLHKLGARNFIVNSLIPLQLTTLYANSSAPSLYWPYVHDGNGWHKRIYNIVKSLNALVKNGVAELNREWKNEGKGGTVQFFDTYELFEDMYNEPTRWFNGSIPPNVVGHWSDCTNCSLADRDSFMWWDDLHPSEQTGRNLAREFLKKILGTSKY